MSEYRVVCVETEEPHEGIIAVGTNDEGKTRANKRWTVAKVRTAIKQGHRFYTVSASTGIEADVELYGTSGITTSADGVADNNLDNLRACSWEPAQS
jgi:phage terminase large subunit-like protein